MKQLCLFTILIVGISSFTYASFSEATVDKMKIKTKSVQQVNPNQPILTIPSKKITKGTIFWEGWVRYFHFHSGVSSDKPTSFFVNNEFFAQKVPLTLRTKKDKNGYVFIPTKFDFFVTVLHDRLLFLSSRDQEITKAADSLKIDFINPLEKGKLSKGPIKDMGKFREGHCISIMASVPEKPSIKFERKDGISENWVVCVSTPKEKKVLFDTLIQMRLEVQKEEEEAKREEDANHAKNAVSISDALTPRPTELFERQPGSTLLDGYLILLKDWSQCTLKCGGGWSYQQWMCVPPKKGGKPCTGDLIRRKPCNTKPCPGTKMAPQTSLTNKNIKQIQGEVLKPILRSLPISKRPQQFLTCVIKESDVLLEKYSDDSKSVEKYPARLIMNKRSISLYLDDKLSNAEFNFLLDKTELFPDDKDLCCFKIAGGNKKYKVCSFGEDCGDETNRKFVDAWQRDVTLFKTRCFDHFKHEKSENVIGQGPKHDKANDILGGMDLSVEESTIRQKAIKKKVEEKNEDNFTAQLGKAQAIAMQAVKKELGIEEMIKREYALKAKSEVDKLMKVMASEKRKQDSLGRALAERQSEDGKLREAREQKSAIKMLKQEAQKEVMNKRNDLKKKIMEIKKKSERRKRIIEQQISIIRGQMTRQLIDANKKGDSQTCMSAYGNAEKIKTYCNNRIVDDFKRNMECKEVQSFCYVCCENEFGNMHILERDECYDLCDKKLAVELEKTPGDFVW